MKEFIFDRLVNRENICDLEDERKQLQKLIERKQNIVLYAQRNYGKTSLVKNVLIEDFRTNNKKSFIFFVDLMGVKGESSITARLRHSLEHSIRESFPIKKIATSVGSFFTNLKATISIDAATGIPAVKIESTTQDQKNITIGDIFQTIGNIGREIPTLIVLDEFQDIALVPEAESLFRDAFQQLPSIPIIILGSKKHLLKNIFTLPDSPLANFGRDVVINQIDYDKYHTYINERFTNKGLTISFDNSKYLQDLMQRQPEAINLLCYEIFQENKNTEVDKQTILKAIQLIIDQRSKRFEVMLSSLSKAEEKVLTGIAKEFKIYQPQSKKFTSRLNLTARTVKANIDKLMNSGILDIEEEQFYIYDPLLALYLRHSR